MNNKNIITIKCCYLTKIIEEICTEFTANKEKENISEKDDDLWPLEMLRVQLEQDKKLCSDCSG